MNRLREPMDDARFDRLVTAALRQHADDLSSRQPAADVALERLGLRLGAQPARATLLDGLVPGRFRASRPASIAWLALLLAGLVTAAIIGAQLLRQERQPIVVVPVTPAPNASAGPLGAAPPFGFGASCTILIDPDVLVEVESSLGDQTSTMTYGRPGYVTSMTTGSFMGFDEGPSTRMLTDEALGLVEDRITADLDLAPGCYKLRTSEAGGLLTVRTAEGLVQIAWSQTAGDTYLARQMPVDESERLRYLAGELAAPDMWLPEGAFLDGRTREWEAHPPHWLVHTILNPTEPLGPPPSGSTGSGRADRIALPDGAALEEFGTPIEFPAVRHPDATQRCASITQDEAIALATSLDSPVLGIDTSLSTPDHSLEIFLSLIPAAEAYDCAAFEADLRANGSTFPVMPPMVTGDLAFVDPCNLAPDAVRGRVDMTGYAIPDLAFGVSARRCVLVNHESFGVASERVQLWLYPSTLTLADAEIVVAAVFGDGATTAALDGHPIWLNHCLDGGACVGAIAAWDDGRLLVLEVLDTFGTPTSRAERARSDMAAILAMAE